MNALHKQLESLLFIAGKPLSVKKLSELVGASAKETEKALEEILLRYEQNEESGLQIMRAGQQYQMATKPDFSKLVETFVASEQTGELTKPSLETLTIVAYRGPITKADLEQIRGVNCSLILRNLLIKGLVEASFDRSSKMTVYQITLPFMEFLGMTRQEQLPNYETLHNDERLQALFAQQEERAVNAKQDEKKEGDAA